MSYSTTVRTLLSLVAFLICAGSVLAQRPATTATFSGPVRLSGVLMPTGSYDFAIERDGSVVVVSDANHKVVATVRGCIPITRSKRGDTVTMRPAVSGQAPELFALFPDGGTTGIEFVKRAAHK